MTGNDAECTVVYNRLNHESVLAAAILMSQIVNAQAVDVSQLIYDGSTEYIWIGIEPVPGLGSFHDTSAHITHTVILDRNPQINAVSKVRRVMSVLGPFGKDKEHFAEESDCDLGVKRTLIDKVCEHFEIEGQEFQKVAFHAANFHKRDAELPWLAFVYNNLIIAEQALKTGQPYIVDHSSDSVVDKYKQAVEVAKRNFTNCYKEVKVQDGGKVKTALFTTMNDFGFHVALRLIRLSHTNFLNLTMGLSGTIAYSNMQGVKFEDRGESPLLLN